MIQRHLTLLLLLLSLAACGTTPTTSGRYNPLCITMEPVKFHAPRDEEGALLWVQGDLRDPTNRWDTVDTVNRVRRNNAAWRALCEWR